ncbi:hypothetical protein ACKWTF_009619 [Chironomus riparius]
MSRKNIYIECAPNKVYFVKFEVEDGIELEEFSVKAKTKENNKGYPTYFENFPYFPYQVPATQATQVTKPEISSLTKQGIAVENEEQVNINKDVEVEEETG